MMELAYKWDYHMFQQHIFCCSWCSGLIAAWLVPWAFSTSLSTRCVHQPLFMIATHSSSHHRLLWSPFKGSISTISSILVLHIFSFTGFVLWMPQVCAICLHFLCFHFLLLSVRKVWHWWCRFIWMGLQPCLHMRGRPAFMNFMVCLSMVVVHLWRYLFRVQCLMLPILFAWNCSFGLSVR